MLFGKKKTSDIPSEPHIKVKKEKLSSLALDHFVEAYKVNNDYDGKSLLVPYITQDGRKIELDGKKLALNFDVAREQFSYFFAQTLPYHQPEDIHHTDFYLSDLIYIVDENGQKQPWASDKKSLVQFVKIADTLGLLVPSRRLEQDPKNPVFARLPKIKPIIHEEKEHPVPGEE